jgi:uncharacterized protein (DUF849 family)
MRTRLREYAVPVLLAAAIALGLVRIGIETRANNQANRTITCQSARSNASQLTALREIADQLGVPVTFAIPEVPPECDGS